MENKNIVVIKLIYRNEDRPTKKARLKVSKISPIKAVSEASLKSALDEKYCLKMARNKSIELERDTCLGFVVSFSQLNDFVMKNPFVEVKSSCEKSLPDCPEIKIVALPTVKSELKQHPTCTLSVNNQTNLKIISGGARIYEKGGKKDSDNHSYLTASYPTDDNKAWVVKAKDHAGVLKSTIIEAYAYALNDPYDEWEVRVFPKNSGTPEHWPGAEVKVGDGYTMTGGGALANWASQGSLLTASYPIRENTWYAKSKDHGAPGELTNITVFAIGIKPKKQCRHRIENEIFVETVPQSDSKGIKRASVGVDASKGWDFVGGGAFADWRGTGSLLTASYPEAKQWTGKSVYESNAPLKVYAIGLRRTL